MAFVRSPDGTLVEIDDKVRVEVAPRIISTVATPAIIADLTARAVPLVLNPDPSVPVPEVTLMDAKGKVIVEGETIQMVDWDSYRAGTDKVYILFHLRDREPDEAEGHSETEIWGEVGTFDTEEAAISAGLALLTA